MNPNRPPTTSWVQMSAAGATPLAGHSSLRRPKSDSPQPPESQSDQSRPVSFISSASSSSMAAASQPSSSQHPLNSSYQFSSPFSGAATQPISMSSTTSSGSSSASAHPSASSSSFVSATQSDHHHHQQQHQQQPLPGAQQLQAAMNELQLAEQQQLLGLTGAPGALAHQTATIANHDDHHLEEEQRRLEESRKLRLQLYVFVLRCVSYPFNAKQTVTGDHRQQLLKLRKSQFESIVHNHTAYLRQSSPSFRCQYQHLKLTQAQTKQLDELHEKIHQVFNKKFLNNEKMRLLVESECCSQQDLRDLFRQNAEKLLKESPMFQSALHQQQLQTRSTLMSQRQQLISGSTTGGGVGGGGEYSEQQMGGQQQLQLQLITKKAAILDTWLMKFEAIIRDESAGGGGDANSAISATTTGGSLASAASSSSLLALGKPGELGLAANSPQTAAGGGGAFQQPQQQTKEQLYQMFQNILTIKKFEHQLLYNALQLDSADEQAAAIRRELDGRVARIAEMERNKKLLPKFVLKEMESLYLEETRMSVNKLMVNLDSLPVMKGDHHHHGNHHHHHGSHHHHQQGHHQPSELSSRSGGVYSGLQKFRRYNSRVDVIGAAGINIDNNNVNELRPTRVARTNKTGATSTTRKAPAIGGLARRLAAASAATTAAAGAPPKPVGAKQTRPVSNFLLRRAQLPLWTLTSTSLADFGKIAAQASLTRDGLAESHPSEAQLSKLDVLLTFNIEVIVMEVRGLRHLAPTREIYCTMEIEASETGRLQTEHVQARKPLWDTQGDFTTNHPLPILKIKLYAVNPSMLSLEDKELGKLVLRPTVLSPKTPEWCTMTPSGGSGGGGGSGAIGAVGTGQSGATNAAAAAASAGGSQTASDNQLVEGDSSGGALSGTGTSNNDELKIRVVVRMDRPQQLKHCGFLYGIGKSTWRKFKRRYHILIQVSQYTFVMCAYREKKAKPTEMLQLDGYTVDYIEPPTDLIMEHCSEITSQEHHQTSSHTSNAFGLAGRLAKPFLKQQLGGGGGGGGSTVGGAGSSDDVIGSMAGSGGGDSNDQQPSAIQTAAALSDELHNKYYFNVVKEGDSVVFACDDEQECFGWVMALYRATGQAHKPTPLRDQYSNSQSHYIDAAFAYNSSASGGQQTKLVGNAAGVASSLRGSTGGGHLSISSMLNGGLKGGLKSSVDVADQRARKHGMDEFIGADPCKFQHNQLFKYLQNETLQYRLQDQFCSLGWFSSGQLFILDEYCARYGVRTCFRHLAYLNSLLDFNQRGYFIDHTLLNYGYDYCSSFVSGQSGQANPMSSVNFDLRPDGVGTVTVEERELFYGVKTKLLKMIERQIANFAHCFPFGKPDGGLKAALSLLERVLMKEHQTTNSMLQNDEVRNLIRKCLEQAALNNYTKLSGQANLLVPPVTINSILNNEQQSTTSSTTPTSTTTPGPPIPELNEQKGQPPANNNSHAAHSLDMFGRKRTQSNLSNSSMASGSYSSSGSGQMGNNNNNNNVVSTSNNQDSFKRRQQQQQQQQRMSITGANNNNSQQDQCLTMAMIINNEHMRANEKLKYLIRLACLCCEQVEENNEYFSDAFAWHSDLMMDHFELFWSLFSVDMDKILNELAAQNPASAGISTSSSTTSNTYGIINSTINAIGGAVSSSNSNQEQQQQQQQTRTSRFDSLTRSTLGSFSGASGGSGGQQTLLAGSGSGLGNNNNNQQDLLGASNREAFVLFQILNNHMRKSQNFNYVRFKSYLCDTFKPKLLRYIDVMESMLTRMVIKACEKDGQVNCQMVEQMFFKLDDLQKFVLQQLRWPDEQLADQLLQRLKLMAYELCDASVQKTLAAFQQLERKSNKWTATTTSYSSPVEMIQMINITLDTRTRSLKLCTFNNFDQMSYHSKIDKLVETALGEMQPGLMAKMLNALDSTLTKLARYDEGNLLAPILSLTYKQGMSSSGKDIGKQYVTFVSNCCDLLRHKINDELWIVTLLEDWYGAQMNTICNWLGERIDHSLHDVQLAALANIMPKIYADMSLQGVSEDKLNIKTYQTIMSRLNMEEAAVLASGGCLNEQPSTSIFNTSILSSLTSSGSSASSSMAAGKRDKREKNK